MKKVKILTAALITVILAGCGSAVRKDQMESAAKADSVSEALVSSSAALETGKDTNRKFIRTAELKFKVKNVINSTYDIENIANNQGGFVTYTKLESSIENVKTTAISSDSSLETTYYSVTNTMTLRVPNTKLDTTLKEISRNIDFLDYRIIKADDVALQILSNNLAQKRYNKAEERFTKAIDNKGKKLKETTAAEELLLNKQEQADNAMVSNLSLNDQINFSTINIIIYQKQTIKRELIFNEKNIKAYEPGFGSKLYEALQFGWNILEAFLVFLVKLWGLALFAFIIFIIIKMLRRRFCKKKTTKQ